MSKKPIQKRVVSIPDDHLATINQIAVAAFNNEYHTLQDITVIKTPDNKVMFKIFPGHGRKTDLLQMSSPPEMFRHKQAIEISPVTGIISIYVPALKKAELSVLQIEALLIWGYFRSANRDQTKNSREDIDFITAKYLSKVLKPSQAKDAVLGYCKVMVPHPLLNVYTRMARISKLLGFKPAKNKFIYGIQISEGPQGTLRQQSYKIPVTDESYGFYSMNSEMRVKDRVLKADINKTVFGPPDDVFIGNYGFDRSMFSTTPYLTETTRAAIMLDAVKDCHNMLLAQDVFLSKLSAFIRGEILLKSEKSAPAALKSSHKMAV